MPGDVADTLVLTCPGHVISLTANGSVARDLWVRQLQTAQETYRSKERSELQRQHSRTYGRRRVLATALVGQRAGVSGMAGNLADRGHRGGLVIITAARYTCYFLQGRLSVNDI